jgi:hypothetical protein
MNRKQLQINSPCDADWDGMDKRGASRFCDHCSKSVHDLSAMTRSEARALVEGTPNLCVRYSYGADGEVIHRPERPLPAGPLARAGRAALRAGLGISLVTGVPALAATAVRTDEDPGPTLVEQALELVQGWLEEPTSVVMGEPAVMGLLEAPPPEVEPEVIIDVMGDMAWVPEVEPQEVPEPTPVAEPLNTAMGGISPRRTEPAPSRVDVTQLQPVQPGVTSSYGE